MLPNVELSNPLCADEEAARKWLEASRWPNGPVCPYCGQIGEKVKALGGNYMGPGWYHCGDCRKKFTVRVGAVYDAAISCCTSGFWVSAWLRRARKALAPTRSIAL